MIKDSNAITPYKFKRAEAIVLLIIFLATSVPLHAFAGAPTIDTTAMIYSALKVAASKFRKQLLDTIANQVITSIQGGKGDPRFVNDLGTALENVAKDAGALALQEALGTKFTTGLCQPGWAINIQTNLSKSPTFGDKALCSLDTIKANYDDFMSHFTKGGWSAWIKVSESQNNPYMVYMTALNETLTKQATKQAATKEEVSVGGGFLGDKVCNTVSYYDTMLSLAPDAPIRERQTASGLSVSEKDLADFDYQKQQSWWEVKCEKWETRTPGKILADATSKSLFKNMDWLASSEEWESYVVAIGDALVNAAMSNGIKAITASDIKKGNSIKDVADITPPSTVATIVDPWRIKLSSNESGKTAYTLDGSEPTFYAKNLVLYTGEPLMVVNSTYPGSTPASLKWKSADEGNNIESARSLPLSVRTPFNLSEISSYIATQDASIPQNIQNDLTSLISSQSVKMAKLANDTSIPKNLIDNLKNYIAIEDLRISLGKATVIPVATLNQLKAMVASPTSYTISDFINSTQSIAVLADMSAEAKNIKQARTDLKTVVNYILEAVGTGFTNITITQLADILSLSPEFNAMLKETENVIAERFLIKLKPWDTTKIYTTVAAVNDHGIVLLSSQPSFISYSLSGVNSGLYSQEILFPNDNKERTLDYAAVDASNTPLEKWHTLKLTPPFPSAQLPYVVNLVPPIAEIKNADNLTVTKDANGFITLDPSLSVDFDLTPNIAGYEWSFASIPDQYDWGSFDKNRDGVFETYGCLFVTTATDHTCANQIGEPIKTSNDHSTSFHTAYSTITGFTSMSVVDAKNGIIRVKLTPATTTSEIRTIKLRVTDDEGLWTEKTATINLP